MKNCLWAILFLVYEGCAQGNQPTPNILPLKQVINNNANKTNLTRYLNEQKWNDLFPERFGVSAKNSIQHHRTDFYSFEAFVMAAKVFPLFLAEGDSNMQKRELAAFLANAAQETSGGWPNAPGGYYKWGFVFIEENQSGFPGNYADTTKKNYPPIPGKAYFGRGPKQLSWNYNYGQFSEAWFGNKDTLLQQPELLSKNSVLSFASAIWFWMTTQPPKPSCHDIMVDKWQPSANDIEKGRLPGFGATVNVINGGLECGSGTDLLKTTDRYGYYQYFCKYFNVLPGENISCSNQKPFGQ